MRTTTLRELKSPDWRLLENSHALRADALTAGWRERRQTGTKHAIEDFLFTYYSTKPSHLRRWHPGAGVVLLGTPLDFGDRSSWRWYEAVEEGLALDVDAYLADREETVLYIRDLLARTASRPANVGCFGLHEWAMIYRQTDTTRHPLPLRLGADGTDAVVEAHPIRCTHFDAFRFFTPDAIPLNKVRLTRDQQPDFEQPGCLHTGMDALKWAMKLSPAIDSALVLDCFDLARDIRVLDMQASPYDVREYGLEPVAIETAEGKAEYSKRQRDFAARSAPLRRRIIEACDLLLNLRS
ncbi:3-methyladenine DNA glycosylase [Sanguibacter suaedae]|uniref:3-methyladenine DNA glycosylase n=1 Tax=Sanguibacter suaedae TaxID=2795737 RepID=A0A934I7A7_9MICO|nr:3-methyladenine DNA glycosylase [Sanguibacter suaedae]MBI9114482.1 3-methyladenine DNA glycosylase [Sanguibacter suaedae]